MASHAEEFEQSIQEFASFPGVTHYIILNSEAVPIRWEGWDNEGDGYVEVVKIAALLSDLCLSAQYACNSLLDPSESTLEKIRLHTDQNEIIIALGRECTLVAFQYAAPVVSVVDQTPIIKEDPNIPPPPAP